MTRIIGITGPKGSGKDTVARMLVGRRVVFDRGAPRDLNLTRPAWNREPILRGLTIGFADPIKLFAQQIYGWSDEVLLGSSELRDTPDSRFRRDDGTHLSPREALQRIGTEIGRQLWSATWTTLGVQHARALLNGIAPEAIDHARFRLQPIDVVCFSDCRFDNEARAIHDAGGIVIALEGRGAWSGTHGSERGVAAGLIDDTIRNTGTITETYELVRAFTRGLKL